MRNPGGFYPGLILATVMVVVGLPNIHATRRPVEKQHRDAYATMMYMGTPRDYEFYVGLRVLLRSLARLRVQADLVVIASKDVPDKWVSAMEDEDGARVVSVDNIDNPFKNEAYFNTRFALTLNKLYAWTLVEYERVVMLDSDNLFLRNADELFQCGQFCAVFINPCIFHTGLFVLQPSREVFDGMMQELKDPKGNGDGADQGFLVSHFEDLLDAPLFKQGPNGTRLKGRFRLPLGYQMDASYYYLKLRWNVPCGANSVITFPSMPWLKPWYWWSWPVLPLGLAWHEQRRDVLGYEEELTSLLARTAGFLIVLAIVRLFLPRFFLRRSADKIAALGVLPFYPILKKLTLALLMVVSYLSPFFLIPRTVHPVLGWTLYLACSSAFMIVVANSFFLPLLPALTLSIGFAGALIAMAFPWYNDGISRVLHIWGYSFMAAPFLWFSFSRLMNSIHQVLPEREAAFPNRTGESPLPQSMKVY